MAAIVSENLANVMERIAKAARKVGRDPNEIKLIAVTKSVEAKKVKEALSCGARIFGENYVQEAEEKIKKVRDGSVKWHFIGHLQKNKVKIAVDMFDVIETVDTLSLAEELNKRADKPLEVFIEVNLAKEKTKTGCYLDGVIKLAKAISELPMLRLTGLMSVPPAMPEPEASRPYFITLRRLAERINKEHIPGVFIRNLSMGMSNDFEVAVEEGATYVRVGTAIFGPRAPK
ncbi:MAG: YggS family pyridoxal phosphate enzyme [Deltaproteobacteria bacterium RIFCSPLOWO2_02_FULL_53_8]|nr:MAG: YggS family pyridoxal phosphate enzyme [Deltaproteobacteria bacterium RIFCSPLOWO2_02_FULL_53_8]